MPARPSQDMHIAAARRRLAHLAGLEAGTEAAERKILESAEARLVTVEDDLAKARRRALLADGPADRYLALTQERARLLDVIKRSRSALAEPEPQEPEA